MLVPERPAASLIDGICEDILEAGRAVEICIGTSQYFIDSK